ncbi:NTP transferase domain-containing protein [Ruminococcaceae bacterium OttesenSCG-928-A11]|nr:NTP transferase domain-containing protein [Ruminococcaceae bacterium OttesenSCG-928-A11]
MTSALIIATGRSGSATSFQPLRQVGDITAAERLILVFQRAGIERVVLVGGAEQDKLEKQIARMGAVSLHNPGDDGTEMLDSVKIGLAYLLGKCRRVLITPVDVPLFTVETVEKLVASRAKLAVPSHGGRAGHPLLLGAGLFDAVLSYKGEGGLEGAVRAMGAEKHYVEVPDAGVLVDIQKRDDYGDLLRQNSLRRIHPELKLYLGREKNFFGPGPHLLLSLIDETDSLATACRQMGISYSKGWKMIENMEKQLGSELVARSRGGREKGKSEVTALGKALLEGYNAFYKDCHAHMQRAYEKHFAGLLDGAPPKDG